ncbi:MAG: hypothetical protein ISR80_04590 [Nitrosopumilus sp.]|nr:hypothetical protein [Nitrosopumilus sp.]MDC4231306.1 hypothetical protein [Nitrosopumilus sp.]
MKICSRCEMISLSDNVIECPGCNNIFADYKKQSKQFKKDLQKRIEKACEKDTSHINNML